MRDKLLQRVRSHFHDLEKGMFDRTSLHQMHDAELQMSKEDTDCGGQAMPTYRIEFNVSGARPVDVFNVIADTLAQPKWLCTGCSISILKNDLAEKVEGFAAAYRAAPLNNREFFQWQAFSANFSANEFIVASTSHNNDDLRLLRDPQSGATVAHMCYSYSHIRESPVGAHVVQMSHFNPRVALSMGPFSARNMYNMLWPVLLKRAPRITQRSLEQASKHWSPYRLVVPDAFLDPRPTASPRLRSAAKSDNGATTANDTDATESSDETYSEEPHIQSAAMFNLSSSSSAADEDPPIVEGEMQKRMPWLIAASVFAVIGYCGCLCAMCSVYGLCSACLPGSCCRKKNRSWTAVDHETQSDCESHVSDCETASVGSASISRQSSYAG